MTLSISRNKEIDERLRSRRLRKREMRKADSEDARLRRIVAFSVLRLCGRREDHTRINFRQAMRLANSQCKACDESER